MAGNSWQSFRSDRARCPMSRPPSHAGARCGGVHGFAHNFATPPLPRLENRAEQRGSRMRVLVVEDEVFLAEALQAGLRHEAIAADVAFDGDEALERISVNDYDAVVLDRDIPGTHGD